MASSSTPSTDSQSQLFQRVHDYPWSTDQEFQGGLTAILGNVTDPAQVANLTLRAKCYYFTRKEGVSIDFDEYCAWLENQPLGNGARQDVQDQSANLEDARIEEGYGTDGNVNGTTEAKDADGVAPKPASFADIVQMITEGRDIPGIKEIPDTILEGQASESTVDKRRKPWESRAEPQAESARPSWMS